MEHHLKKSLYLLSNQTRTCKYLLTPCGTREPRWAISGPLPWHQQSEPGREQVGKKQLPCHLLLHFSPISYLFKIASNTLGFMHFLRKRCNSQQRSAAATVHSWVHLWPGPCVSCTFGHIVLPSYYDFCKPQHSGAHYYVTRWNHGWDTALWPDATYVLRKHSLLQLITTTEALGFL